MSKNVMITHCKEQHLRTENKDEVIIMMTNDNMAKILHFFPV
jgi:hypothetical protein